MSQRGDAAPFVAGKQGHLRANAADKAARSTARSFGELPQRKVFVTSGL
jgi:hypothetical protein